MGNGPVARSSQCGRFPSWPPNLPVSAIRRRNSSWLICWSVQCPSPTGMPAMKAVRLAASSGSMPFSRRCRYVARVVCAVGVAMLGAVLDVPVLGVKGTETTEDLAAIVDELVATVPRGRLLELPGNHQG